MSISWMSTFAKTRGIATAYLVITIFFFGIGEGLCRYPYEQVPDTTKYFSFHNNYWINLHHFLYQKASGNQVSKLHKDNYQMLVIGENEIEETLNEEQRTNLDSAIAYYKNNIIQKGLLFDLGNERYWLQQQIGFTAIADTSISKDFVAAINRASKTYRETYWPIHKTHNETILKHQIANIQKLEKHILPRMEQLSLTSWPSGERVRIDVSVYANYAGAYTPTRPIFNVIISTIDPRSYGPEFLETIFHEGSHLLFRYGSPWRESLFQTFETGKYKMEYPRHLWHVSLFYLCGQVCKEEFGRLGINDYQMLLFTRNIFMKYHHVEVFEILKDHMHNSRSLDATATKLLQFLDSLPKKN